MSLTFQAEAKKINCVLFSRIPLSELVNYGNISRYFSPIDVNCKSSMSGVTLLEKLLAWITEHWAGARESERQYLTTQLGNLYGPVWALVDMNEKTFQVIDTINGSALARYDSSQYHESARERVRAKHADAIQLANDYVATIVGNNDKICSILQAHWHMIDVEDIEECERFQLDHLRYKHEATGAPRKQPLREVSKAHGEIFFIRSTFVDVISRKMREKRDRLETLRGGLRQKVARWASRRFAFVVRALS